MLLALTLACTSPVDPPPLDSDPLAGDETCNGRDDDLDGAVDEGLIPSVFADGDGDGFGDPERPAEHCMDTEEGVWVGNGDDCDDARQSVHPDADELCDDLDNDCDVAVDEDPVDAGAWFTDQDRDGYGTGDGTTGCDQPPDTSDRGGDCDDLDPDVNPDAVEICDGIDNDCDAGTSEDQTAWFQDGEGAWSDWTQDLNGRWGNPDVRVITEPGRLQICEGDWFAQLRVRADVTVQGIGDVALKTGQAGGVVIVRTDAVVLELHDLTLADGSGAGAVLGEYTAGGGLECAADATVTLSGVTLRDNTADIGAGLFVQGCAVSGSDVAIHDNAADWHGGGLAVLAGSVTLTDSVVETNQAAFGGGAAVVGYDGVASFDAVDTWIQDNLAVEGGGVLVEDAAFTCTASSGVDAGVQRNTADSSGGVFPTGWAWEITSTGCDWGAGADDNSPDDGLGNLGLDESFVCDQEGCS
jgi:hypothetical protein